MKVCQRRDKDGNVFGPFWYDFRVRGQRYRHSTGLIDRKAAEQKAWNTRDDVVSGEYERQKSAANAPSLGRLNDRFLQEYKGRYGDLRSRHYQHRLPHVKAALGRMRAAEVKVVDVHGFRDRRLAAGASTGTVRKEMIALGTVYKWGMQADLVPANPVYAADKPPEPRHREPYLTPKEWTTLYRALPVWLQPLASVSAFTGLRLKEVTNITRSDIDRNIGQLYVQRDNKTGRGRYVMMLDIVASCRAGREAVVGRKTDIVESVSA